MKLVTIIDTFPGLNGKICVGGPETNLDRLTKFMAIHHGDEVKTTVFIHRGTLAPSPLAINQESAEAKIIRSPSLLKLTRYLIRHQNDFDLLYFLDKTVYFRPHLFLTLLRNIRKPILLRVTSTKYLDYARKIPSWVRKALYRLLLNRRSNIFFLSLSQECTKRLKALGIPEKNLVIIPNAVDLDRYTPPSDAHRRIQKRFEIFGALDPRACVFVYVGRIIGWHKRVDHMLEAWEQSGLADQGHKLLLIGAPKRDVFITDGFRLWENAGPQNGQSGPGKLAGTYWAGLLHVSKIPEYLWMSDCFVLPSDFEGMSNAAVEALASGLPIIGRKGVSGNVELIEPKVTGQFFETIPELAQQMQWFASFENRQGMREACLARSKNFSVETMCRSYLQFFKDSHRALSQSR